jgi:hypothetical protein
VRQPCRRHDDVCAGRDLHSDTLARGGLIADVRRLEPVGYIAVTANREALGADGTRQQQPTPVRRALRRCQRR